jgi:hypothetical protein
MNKHLKILGGLAIVGGLVVGVVSIKSEELCGESIEEMTALSSIDYDKATKKLQEQNNGECKSFHKEITNTGEFCFTQTVTCRK